MRAVVAGSAGAHDVLRLTDVPDPSVGPGECLITIEAAGVCGHDVAARAGLFRRGVEFPAVLGHEMVGRVIDVHADVDTAWIGTRVATMSYRRVCGQCYVCIRGLEPLCGQKKILGDAGLEGCYSEQIALPVASLVEVPETMPAPAAAIAPCAVGTALHAVRDQARASVGETVLVTGASGGVGVHAAQVAVAAGCRVLGVSRQQGAVALLESLGIEPVLLVPGTSLDDVVGQRTGGYGCDIAIDTVGSALFHEVRRSLRIGGRMVLVGEMEGTPVTVNPAQLFLRGISIFTATASTRAQAQDAVQLVKSGAVNAVTTQFPLAEAGEAHRALETRSVFGRAVLTI